MSLRTYAALVVLALGSTALLLTSCFDTNTVTCSGGVVCPAGSVCTADGLGCVSATGCGDGVVAGDEECDDGNQDDEDDCTAVCRFNICGDGFLDLQGDAIEECDSPGAPDTDECDGAGAGTQKCTVSECGDGHTNAAAGEICDDGNQVSGDGCKNDCTSAEECGNNIIDSHLTGMMNCASATATGTNCPEVCDDDNTIAADGCSANCLSDETCGNGIRDELGGPGNPPENCDDGDPLDLSCSDDCQGGVGCGNGLVEPLDDEQCDNGMEDTDTADCDRDCTAPDCGDGHFNMPAGELCDPGTGTIGGSTSTCNNDCTLPACGDGLVNRAFIPIGGTAPEQCDDGNTDAGDGCSALCRIESCGNGTTEMINGEQCDDGNTNDLDACRTNCQLPRCGDGIASTPPNEVCDTNGNSQTCNADCTAPACGDGKVNTAFTPTGGTAPESCDDGNTVPGDGCSAVCRIESCGNGITEAINGEECDDGNTVETDDCRNSCQAARCGDSVVDMQGPMTEVCDTGANSSTCDFDCTAPQCGDGIVNTATTPLPEQCEDGNLNNGDGCSSTCRLEPFQVTVNKAGTGSGTVTSSPAGINCGNDCTELYLVGTMVTLTAAPSASSTFTGWSGEGCSGTGTCVLTMDAAKTVTATFASNTLTVTRDGTGTGTVTSSPAGINCGNDCTETVNTGTMITLTAAANSDSLFSGWTGGGCSGTGTCVVTMNQATSVAATFTLRQFTLSLTKAGTGTGAVTSGPAGIDCGTACLSAMADFTANTMVTLVASPDSNSNFTGWSGSGCTGTGNCTVTMSMARSVTATFTFKTFTVTVTRSGSANGDHGTVTSSPSGINCGGDCSEAFTFGTMVTLTAVPSAGNVFTGWSGGTCSGTAPCTFVVDGNVTINAAFTDNKLTVVRTGNGSGSVSSSPSGITCGNDCSQDYDANTTVTLTATAGSAARFTGWSGGGCSGTGTCVVTMTAATTVVADFIDTYVLTLNKSGAGTGNVTSSPSGVECGTSCSSDTGTYDDNTVVTLSAVADAGSVFTGWSGSGCSGTGTCQVTLSNNRTVTATFVQAFTLTVTKAGTGAALGTVQSSPGGIDCGVDCTESYTDGTNVTLTASVTGGGTFTGWSGAGTGGCGSNTSCVVAMTVARSVTATFAAPSFTLTVTKAGTGAADGTVTSSPAGINCGADCSEPYVSGTMVTLTAAVANGATFTSWSGAAGCSTATTCIVTVTAAQTVTATFAAPSFALTVAKAGAGAANGTVTSSPAGINCGADCSESYVSGTMVTLTAAVANGATFTSWSGAAGCTTATTCIVTVSAAQTVTATFGQTFALNVTVSGPMSSGTVTSNPAGINCPGDCSETLDSGTMVVLTATPAMGSTFTGWSGSGCMGTGTCNLTMDAAKNVTATFTTP